MTGAPQAPIHSFTTERGSVYTSREGGTWERFKQATEKRHTPLDITVFGMLDDRLVGVISDMLDIDGRKMPTTMMGKERDESHLVLEELGEEPGSSTTISRLSDITNPSRLVVTRYFAPDNGDIEIRDQFPVSLEPQMGATPIEFKTVADDVALPWHVGHAVIALTTKQ